MTDIEEQKIIDDCTDLESRIEQYVESEVEYQESHTDAGDNYAHLISEGYWPDYRAKIVQYVLDNFETKLSEQELHDGFDSCNLAYVEMRSEHIFGSTRYSDGVALDSWPIQEIECQIDLKYLSDDTGFDLEYIKVLLKRLDIKISWDSILQYCSSDAVWVAVLTDDCIESVLESLEG